MSEIFSPDTNAVVYKNRGRIADCLYLDTVTQVSVQAPLSLRQWLRTFSILPRRTRVYALTLISFKTTTIVVAWTIGSATRLFIMVTNGLVRVASEPSKVTSPSEVICQERKNRYPLGADTCILLSISFSFEKTMQR